MQKKASKQINAIKRAGMTEWYDYKQLLSTANKTVLSTLVGEYADPRLGMADPTHGKFFDYSKELRALSEDETRNITEIQEHRDFKALEEKKRNEIWIDYVADVGDGWNSTYAVAYYLSQQAIEVNGEKLPRGEILIFGGDAVYPTASDEKYEDQLVAPYRAAFKGGGDSAINRSDEIINLKDEPHVFALPGNHDWYDSLTAFKKVFCSDIFNDRKFACDEKKQTGGWRTRQKRSYFVLKLPHKWWLFGIDLQLSHNIDVAQLEYLESLIRDKMTAGDKVILCVPEPYWVKAIKYENLTGKFDEKEESIQEIERYFEERKIDVKVYLAGDLHHYRRFEDEAGTQKITAGGGGAFLHPTHDYDFNVPPKKEPNEEIKDEKTENRRRYTLKKSYPEVEESRKLDWKNFLFIRYNKTFGVVTAVLYALLAALLHGKINYGFSLEPTAAAKSLIALLNNLTTEPVAVLVIMLMFGGVYFFTDTNDKKYKWRAGLTHGFAHLFAVLLFGWLNFFLVFNILNGFNVTDPAKRNLISFALSVFIFFPIGGYLLGSIIMGLYLLVSLHFFGRHDNEAFSALKIEDYKNFLRFHISDKGLTIYPLKIEKAPRHWKPILADDGETVKYCEPFDQKSLPELIENPIWVGEADLNQLNRQMQERKNQ